MSTEHTIRIKRIYDEPESSDGMRILVDRLWPRGISKEGAKLDLWLRDIAPSNELRRWSHEQPERWEEFKKRYFDELKGNNEVVQKLREMADGHDVTLLYAKKDGERNNASALMEYLTEGPTQD
ncbi:MAG: DUF488 domain-containing protein [Candidatus Xenobiia bacterium LiM19]